MKFSVLAQFLAVLRFWMIFLSVFALSNIPFLIYISRNPIKSSHSNNSLFLFFML